MKYQTVFESETAHENTATSGNKLVHQSPEGATGGGGFPGHCASIKMPSVLLFNSIAYATAISSRRYLVERGHRSESCVSP